MKIQLSENTKVRITWQPLDAAIEAQIVERLNTVPGIEGRGRRWYAPTLQVARLMQLFPKASYDYNALRASDRLAQAFFNMLVYFHLGLAFDESGAIVAIGHNVSPLIQQLVDERVYALRPLVAAGHGRLRPRQQDSQGPWQGPLTADDAKFAPLLKGIENAKKAAADEVKYPRRRRKTKAKQEGLGV